MDQADTASLAEVLGAIVDADEDIIELERDMLRRFEPADVDLVMQDYRCTIVSVVARTLDQWKAAHG